MGRGAEMRLRVETRCSLELRISPIWLTEVPTHRSLRQNYGNCFADAQAVGVAVGWPVEAGREGVVLYVGAETAGTADAATATVRELSSSSFALRRNASSSRSMRSMSASFWRITS